MTDAPNQTAKTRYAPGHHPPLDRRLSEAVAGFLLGFPRGYDLPPLEVIVKQMAAALSAADKAQFRSEAEERVRASCARAGVEPISIISPRAELS